STTPAAYLPAAPPATRTDRPRARARAAPPAGSPRSGRPRRRRPTAPGPRRPGRPSPVQPGTTPPPPRAAGRPRRRGRAGGLRCERRAATKSSRVTGGASGEVVGALPLTGHRGGGFPVGSEGRPTAPAAPR